jgi:hypothetical protein
MNAVLETQRFPCVAGLEFMVAMLCVAPSKLRIPGACLHHGWRGWLKASTRTVGSSTAGEGRPP